MQEKPKNQELNREERKNLRLFKKQAAEFPWLLREGDVWLKGWKSQEPFKNLRILRNLLALLLALSMGLRYELTPLQYLFYPILVLATFLITFPFLNVLFLQEKKFGREYTRLNGFGGLFGKVIYMLFGLMWLCLISYLYASSLTVLILPNETDNSSLSTAFITLLFFLSPMLILSAIMGAWHIGQAIYWFGVFLLRRNSI